MGISSFVTIFLRDVLYFSASSTAVAPKKEGSFLNLREFPRPADIFFPHWDQGQPFTLDVTVISPLQLLTINQAASLAGRALSVCEIAEVRAHFLGCRSTGIRFIPLVVETLSCWSARAIQVIQCLGELQGSRLGVGSGSGSASPFPTSLSGS